MRRATAFASLYLLSVASVFAEDFTYSDIAIRHKDAALSAEAQRSAKMQGECLVGLKALTFKGKSEFDPVAEWTNYRSISLLEQFSPCEVLIMMEVAQPLLRQQQSRDNMSESPG